MTHDSSPALQIADLHAGYMGGPNILHGLTIDVAEGEFLCVIGPNGSGKSTFAKALLGLIAIRQGSVLYRGQSLVGKRTSSLRALGIGFVPQTENVFEQLSVVENLEIGLGRTGRGARGEIDAVVDRFDVLKPFLHRRAGSLSGGERQVLALCRALLAKPTLMVLDEPSAALSPKAAALVFEAIRRIHADGMTIVMVEQNVAEGLRTADSACVLIQGQLAFSGDVSELQDPETLRAMYFGEVSAQEAQ